MEIFDGGMLASFRQKRVCEWCGRLLSGAAEPHHLWRKGMGGGGQLDIAVNLIALCLYCHRSHHDGNQPLTIDLLAKVAARENVQQEDIIVEVARLRRLDKHADPNGTRPGNLPPYPGDRPDPPVRQGRRRGLPGPLPPSLPGGRPGLATGEDGWYSL